jgi:hypothetical protein
MPATSWSAGGDARRQIDGAYFPNSSSVAVIKPMVGLAAH